MHLPFPKRRKIYAESYLQTAFEDITATFDSDIDVIDEKMKLDECKTYLNVGDSNER